MSQLCECGAGMCRSDCCCGDEEEEEDTWWDEHFNAEDCKYYLLVFCFFSMVLVKPN